MKLIPELKHLVDLKWIDFIPKYELVCPFCHNKDIENCFNHIKGGKE